MELVQLASYRTVFPKQVRDVPTSPVKSTGLFVLKSAAGNRKLGDGADVFTRGPWRGMPLYVLTLEERATCPMTCPQLVRCYGNNMPFAVRYQHGPALDAALDADVALLALRHPAGVVVRLHALGDFVDEQYVANWDARVKAHPELHIYGYTHWPFGTPVGDAVTAFVLQNPGRVSILRSDADVPGDPLPRAVVVPKDATAPHPDTAVICPEQTGKSASCLTCGLCLNGRTSVSFLDHGRIARKLLVTPTKEGVCD